MIKYSDIYLKHPLIFTPLYLLIFLGIIILIDKINIEKTPFISRKFFIYLSLTIVILTICWITFMPRFGQIGRFPAINDWLERILSGKFPYTYPITPSGFPFLFFISIPFYIIGNVGYLEVLGLILFLSAIYYYSKSTKEMIFRLLIILMCPVFCYSFVVRDELFFNMMLVIVIIFLAENYLNAAKINLKFISFAILFGLALSTRSVVVIIYAVYLLYVFKSNIFNGVIFFLIIALTFGALIIPFYLWNPQSFMIYGPFAVQSHLSYLPKWIVIAAIGLSIYLGWLADDLRKVFLFSGILLFTLVLISMLFRINEMGLSNAVINDGFDISYFIFCIPFLLLSFRENKALVI
jgi:hypothetical protein